MVRIRLRRMGARKQPFYRIVVADQRSPRDGRFIEILGSYDPKPDPPEIAFDVDRMVHWIKVGARPSDSVVSLLRQKNIVDENGKLIAGATDEEAAQAEANVAEETAEEGTTEEKTEEAGEEATATA